MSEYWRKIDPRGLAYDEEQRPFEICWLKYNYVWDSDNDYFAIHGAAISQLREKMVFCKNYIIVIDISDLDNFSDNIVCITGLAKYVVGCARERSAVVVLTKNEVRRVTLNKFIHKDGEIKKVVYAALHSQFDKGFVDSRGMYDAHVMMKAIHGQCAQDLFSEIVPNSLKVNTSVDMELAVKLTQKVAAEEGWGEEDPSEHPDEEVFNDPAIDRKIVNGRSSDHDTSEGGAIVLRFSHRNKSYKPPS